jgi:hypothetical protein
MLTFRPEILHGGFACSDDIPYSFVVRIWHPNCRQFARTMKSGKSERISTVGFDALTRPLWDERGSNDAAVMSEISDLAIQTISRRACFIAK